MLDPSPGGRLAWPFYATCIIGLLQYNPGTQNISERKNLPRKKYFIFWGFFWGGGAFLGVDLHVLGDCRGNGRDRVDIILYFSEVYSSVSLLMQWLSPLSHTYFTLE